MDKAPQNCQSKHRIKYHKIGHNHIRGTTDSPKGPMWSYFHHSEYILYSVKLRIKSTILTVNQVAMCYLALPFTSQYFIQTPIAMIIIVCMWCACTEEVARILQDFRIWNWCCFLLEFWMGTNLTIKCMQLSKLCMVGTLHAVCSTLREGNKQPPLLHTSNIK